MAPSRTTRSSSRSAASRATRSSSRTPAAKPNAATKPSKPKSPAKPAAAKPAAASASGKPSKAAAAKPATASTASKPLSKRSTPVAPSQRIAPPAPPPPPVAARFGFTAVPLVRDVAGLNARLREQLVVDARVRTGRVTTADRIPTSYFHPGVVRWRVSERGKPMFDVVHDTAFFPDSAEPVGLERIAGLWQATGRGSARGRALDLPRLAWELTRDWPGRRLALPPEPKPGSKWKPIADEPEAAWPPDTQFV